MLCAVLLLGSLAHLVFRDMDMRTPRNIRWGSACRCRTRGPLDPLGRLTKEQHVTQSNRKGHGLQQLMRRRLSSMGKCGNRKKYCRSQREGEQGQRREACVSHFGCFLCDIRQDHDWPFWLVLNWHTRCNIHYCCGGRQTPLMFTFSMR